MKIKTEPSRHVIIVCALLLTACSIEYPDASAAQRTPATQTAAAQPPPATATSSSSPTAPTATPTSPQPSSTAQPTQTALSTTAPAATGTTPPEPTPTATVVAPTATITQAADILTTLPEFTLPEVGPSAATAYDPKGLVSMRGFSPFIPLDNPLPVPAAVATWLRPDDFVLGVKHGSEARAYPISQVEYHHIVNDTIAGEPYLVTY